MQRMLAVINRFLEEDAAQDLTEYGLLAALIACFAIGALGLFGQMLQNTFWQQVVNLAQNI